MTIALALAGPARAACGDPEGVRCISDLDSVNAVARTTSGFVAVGPSIRDGVTRSMLVTLSRSGDVTLSVALPWPGGRQPEGRSSAEPRKIIPLPNGDAVVIGQARLGDEPNYASWAMRVSERGEVRWWRSFSDPAASVVLVSGLYEAASDRLILVGRLTDGTDDGQCARWSQSLAVTVSAGTGQAGASLLRGDRVAAGQNREALFDIAAGDQPGRYVTAGFRSVPAGRPGPRRCFDVATIGALAPSANPGSAPGATWTLSDLGRLATPEASEVVFSIKPAGPAGTYVLGGYRRDQAGQPPAALAHLVRTSVQSVAAGRPSPFQVVRSLVLPFPANGSDRSGGDRFRVVAPMAALGKVLMAGSVSTGDRDPNRAIWQVAGLDLQRAEPPTISALGGTDVLDAVAEPDGTVLLAGRWSDPDGRRVGFVHVVSVNPAATVRTPMPAPAEGRPTEIGSLPRSDDRYRLPATASLAGGLWSGSQLPVDGQIALLLGVPSLRTLRISAAGDRGEMDLVVTDGAGRPVAFSNFRGRANEMLIATLPPGEYTLMLIAHAGASTFQLRLAPARELPVQAIALLQRLSEEARTRLVGELAAAGYAVSAEPSIALGAETARSLIAAQDAAGPQRSVGPNGIGRAVSALTAAQP